jgi:RHS repeat-associated protein
VKVIQNIHNPTYNVTADKDLSHHVAVGFADQDLISQTVYDSAGRIQYTTDIQGNKTWYVYDGMGRQIKTITNCSYGSGTPPPEDSAYRGDLGNPAADIITETVYDANGRVQKTKRVLKTNQAGNDLEWLWTLYGYDTLGRQVKGIQNASNPGYNITTDPDLSGYTPSGNSDEDITSETVYDVLGRVQQTIDTHGNVTFYGYDTVGRRVKVVQNASNTAYDVDGDLDLSGYTPAGGAGSDQDRITSTEYDLAGRVTRLTDATGLVTLNLYDRLGRRVRTISNYQTQGDPAGWVWDENDSRWEDSSGGPIAHTTDADQNLVADTTYNKAGQVVSTRDTRGTTTRFVYDAAGRQQQVKQAADSALETVSYTCYDKASRVLRTIAHWVPAYDETQQPILPDEKDSGGQWVFNPQPDLTYPDQNRVIEYKYDTAGRPIETTDEVRNKTLTTYTKGGNVVSVTDPAGYITRYVYDALRHPIRVIQNYRVDNSQKIVFQSSPDSGNSSIFVMSSDGINLTRLTNPNGWLTDDWPALSPDGNYVSFYRDRQLDGVYIVESDGSNERLLTNSGGYISVWSPDGSKLLIHNGNPSSAIYVINADGSGQTSLTPHGTSPAWSPDGNKIAFYAIAPDGHLEIYTINANGSGIQCLTNKDMLVRGLPTPPAWSPDSSKIVFECYPGYSNTEIYVMNANGSNQLRLTSSGHTPIWSPVGSQIAFVSPGDVYSLGNLCLIHPDGTNQQYLTDSDDVYLRDIVWSPDGSRIGFSRRYKGLWVVNTDGSGSTVLTNHSETILPQWSPGRAAPTRWIWNATANPSQWEDGEGHPILHGDNNDQNVIVQFTYDKSGRKTSMRDPRGHLTTYSHDKLSRRTKLTNPLPEEWTTTYSNLTGGARVVLTDPNGYNTQRDFDRLGRLKTIDYLGETPKLTPDVTFTYDAAGNRASMVEDNGTANVRITGYVYDDVRRLKQVNFDTDGDANVDETVAYQYNLRGQRTKLTLPSSRDVTYAYDQRGRLTSLTDWDSHQAQFVYDHANRLVSTERANGLTSRYHYDTAGRLRQLRHTQGKRTLAHFDYEVDQRGNRTQALEVLAHPATTTDTIYAYNDDNLLYRGIWTDDVVNGFKVTTSVSASLKLMFFGSAATLTVGTGTDHGIFDVYVSGSLWRSFDGYTASNGARDITLSLASEGPHLLEIRNRAEHNLASSGYGLRFKQLVVPDVAYTLHTIEYTYDGLSRLNKARYNPGLNVNAADGDLLRRYQYTYDLAGNRLSESVALNGGAPTVTNRTYNAANQISNAGFVYDANGNLTNDGTNTYIWDRANRLTTMGGLSYTYDGLGNRVSQTTNSIVTRYLLDLQPSLVHVLAATTPSTTTRFVHGPRGTLAHENNAGAWSWMVQDGLGSVRGEVSNSVAVDGIQSFAPYGTAFDTQGTFETPHAFTGEMLDGNDLLYLRARYYSPTLGIFPSLDPVENLNRYQYVSANPTNWTDPTGLQDDGGCMIYWGDPEGYAQCMGYTCPPGWLNTGNFTYQCTPAPSSDTTGGTFTSADAWAIHWAGLSDAETAQYGYHGGTASFLETLAVGFVAGTGAALGGAVIGTALAACPVCTGVGAYLGESFGRRHGNYIWLHAVSGACGPCIQAQALEVGQAAFVSAYGERGFYWGALTGGAAFISPAAAGIGLSIISSGEAYSAAQDIEAKGSNPCNTAQLILGAFGAASSITIARSGHRLTQTRPPATQEQILSILELTQNRRIHGVIGETLKYAGSGNRSSTYVLTPDEALSAGLLWVSREYIELNTQGVFRSKFPDSNGYYHIFRIDEASLMGAHPPNVPHVHLELILSQKGVVNVHENVVNNHIPIR